MQKPSSILLFGSCDFSREYLKQLLLGNASRRERVFEYIGVVTTTSEKRTTFENYCKESKIDIHYVTQGLGTWKIPLPTMSHIKPYDMALVASFDHYIPSRIIQSFSMGALNVHPSLLPKYRGASPMQQAILNRDRETGVSIVTLSKGRMDCGNIIRQSKMSLTADTDFKTLSAALAKLGARDTLDVLEELPRALENAVSQSDDHPDAKFAAPKFDEKIRMVDFSRQTAQEIYASYLAYGYYYPPLAQFYSNSQERWLDAKILEILNPDTNPLPKKAYDHIVGDHKPQVGSVYVDLKSDILWILCAGDTWLPCKKFRLQEKFLGFTPKMLCGYGIDRMTRVHIRSRIQS